MKDPRGGSALGVLFRPRAKLIAISRLLASREGIRSRRGSGSRAANDTACCGCHG